MANCCLERYATGRFCRLNLKFRVVSRISVAFLSTGANEEIIKNSTLHCGAWGSVMVKALRC